MALVPTTASLEIASPPDAHVGPARTEAPVGPGEIVGGRDGALALGSAQVTETLVTLAEPTVPDPLATEQAWPEGLVATVTAKDPPWATAVAKVKAPLALTLRLSPPLSWRTTVPEERPETVPPMV